MTDDHVGRYLEERERRERAVSEGIDAVEEAGAVFAPAPLPIELEPPDSKPSPSSLLSDRFDRLVTYPIWFVVMLAIHVVLLAAAVGTPLFVALLIGVVLSQFVGPVPGFAVGGFLALPTLFGTVRGVYLSFVTKLSQCPW
jgi:hypothetical protein